MIKKEKIENDCRDLELISMHIPKSGGTSLLSWFCDIFGPDKVLQYSDSDPADLASIGNLDPDGYLESFEEGYPELRGKKVVHGHFWIKKYQHINNVLRVTILRNPVDRLISDYWNMKIFAEGRETNPGKRGREYCLLIQKWRAICRKRRSRFIPVKKYFMENKLDIVQYARLPLVRNIYNYTFFRGVDVKVFDMIGDHANMVSELGRLREMLGVKESQSLPMKNVTSFKSFGYREFKENILGDAKVMGRIRDLLSDDIDFYEKHAGT